MPSDTGMKARLQKELKRNKGKAKAISTIAKRSLLRWLIAPSRCRHAQEFKEEKDLITGGRSTKSNLICTHPARRKKEGVFYDCREEHCPPIDNVEELIALMGSRKQKRQVPRKKR
jgi:hypothetical protein